MMVNGEMGFVRVNFMRALLVFGVVWVCLVWFI